MFNMSLASHELSNEERGGEKRGPSMEKQAHKWSSTQLVNWWRLMILTTHESGETTGSKQTPLLSCNWVASR